MSESSIGVVGGSGLYEIDGLASVERVSLETPYGHPSDDYVVGELDGQRLVFLPRHGRGHRLLPHEVNYCANIYGFKSLGVEWLISVSAVGSMREAIVPGHVVVVDQFIDRTRERRSTFFGDGIAAHIAFADPVCADLAAALFAGATEVGAVVHRGGTYLCIEGPQFSTRAESALYRSWGVDVIGMTNLPEAKLAREAGLCYATLALATDYDCWYEGHDAVSVETVIDTLNKNVEMARRIVAAAVKQIPNERRCGHRDAGKLAVVTSADAQGAEARARLTLLLD